MTRYELLDRIGVGGMAEIFRGKAVAAGGFEKPVAIKRILPHLSQDKRFVELLIAEAKVLSLLKHRNIVQIFDVGLGDDGQYFLVMEYVDGKDLGGIQRSCETRRRRIPFDLCLHIGAEICEALEHAHSAKAPDGKPMSLVHRDVSPSNILLSRAGEIKLTDFGIAKRAEQEQTGTGGVRGKFAYISPEQARNEHIDPRSDVFAVAVVLWELVTNQRLFSGMGDLEALRAVREAQVRRPSEADPRLSQELDALLMSALSRDPKRRPTAGQFGAQLQSMRYAMETTVGDPATELAKIIDAAEGPNQNLEISVARPGVFDGNEHTEATVIRLRTADAFSLRDKDGQGFTAARKVIDQFEEEETRLAQLSGDQLRMLRGRQTRDSSELSAPPSPRTKRPTDEPTTARAPLDSGEIITRSAGRSVPSNPFDGDEATRLVAPTNRRTPAPERVRPRAATAPPPLPGMPLPPAPAPQDELMPGTVHHRNPQAAGPGPLGPMPQQQPLQRPGPTQPPPMQQPPMQQMPQPPRGYEQSSQSQSQRPQGSTQPPPNQQPPMLPTPMQRPQHQLPMQPPVQQAPTPQPGNYPMWGVQSQLPPRAASPTAPDMMDRPVLQQHQRNAMPNVAGFGAHRKAALQPWMLVVGALIMAALAFAVTRAFIAG
ncbi:MAG: serine/threonine protein kinase [Myxococcales bacterium]|nr:serine/threonine protein kinase [Myxococcales bacterium]